MIASGPGHPPRSTVTTRKTRRLACYVFLHLLGLCVVGARVKSGGFSPAPRKGKWISCRMRAGLFASFALASAGLQNLTASPAHIIVEQQHQQQRPRYLQQQQQQATSGTLHVGDLSVESLVDHPRVSQLFATAAAPGRGSAAFEQEVQRPGTQLIRRSLQRSVQQQQQEVATQAACVERELLSDNEEIVNAAPALPYEVRGLPPAPPPSPLHSLLLTHKCRYTRARARAHTHTIPSSPQSTPLSFGGRQAHSSTAGLRARA